jgi:hypothetical protein
MRIAVRSTEPSHQSSRYNFQAWTSHPDFADGRCAGVAVIPGNRRGIRISRTVGTLSYYDPFRETTTIWAYGSWTSPVKGLDFGATRLVMSWNGKTPRGTFLIAEIQAMMQDGGKTPWMRIGNYAFFDTDISRTSISPVAQPYGEVDTDTFLTYQDFTVRAYRLRVTLCRRPGTEVSPRVWQVSMLASAIPPRERVPASVPGPSCAEGIELRVPRYSQYIHQGHYQEYDGGGRSWCSPASTQMSIEYWGKGPGEGELTWVRPGHQDPQVVYAAHHIYDHRYQGTGNWAFNIAYASHFGLNAQIVQLPSMGHLERLVAYGIPVVTGQAFDEGEITGASYKTVGHLWVVTGFTKAGDVIVNDPASPANPQVRHVFDRHQFENAWLRTFWRRNDGTTGYGTGGIAYIIKPHEMKLPNDSDPVSCSG